MKRFCLGLLLASSLLLGAPALAQSLAGPQQIQTMIAAGQEGQAVQALQQVLQTHPKSAVAWYLLAEAYDAQGQKTGAADALNMAERLAPGLPFANAQKAAALRAHINGSQSGIGGGHIAIYVIAGLVLLLLALRFLPGRNVAQRNYGYTAPPPPPGTPPYGYGYGPRTGPFGGGFGGGGMGSALMGGLAAGAGFAAGERIIDGMMGPHNNGGPVIDQNGLTQGPDLSRDDGLMGNPGWDDNSGLGGTDDGLNNNDGWS